MTDLAAALAAPRIKLVARLAPLAGRRFQPTGFPDLGPAVYEGPDGQRCVLVESAQSMANRLEAVLWPVGATAPIDEVVGLPYVRVQEAEGRYLTSSRTESHRLASAYIRDATFGDRTGLELIAERLGTVKGRPMNLDTVHRAIFDLDPLALVHGVFFADDNWFGQPKVARAVTAFIEAEGAAEWHSGGVKFDHVSNSGDAENDRRAKQGYGNVPFPRTEYVADTIEATFVIDTAQIRRYRLEQTEKELLLALALLEIRGLLDEGLRLRTACDLEVAELVAERPDGFELADWATLAAAVAERIDRHEPLVGMAS